MTNVLDIFATAFTLAVAFGFTAYSRGKDLGVVAMYAGAGFIFGFAIDAWLVVFQQRKIR